MKSCILQYTNLLLFIYLKTSYRNLLLLIYFLSFNFDLFSFRIFFFLLLYFTSFCFYFYLFFPFSSEYSFIHFPHKHESLLSFDCFGTKVYVVRYLYPFILINFIYVIVLDKEVLSPPDENMDDEESFMLLLLPLSDDFDDFVFLYNPVTVSVTVSVT